MKEIQGRALPLGATITGDIVNFAAAVPEGRVCSLLLYRAGEQTPVLTYQMTPAVGSVHCIALSGLDPSAYEYNYQMDDEIVVDPYARALAGREVWGRERDVQNHEVRCVLCNDSYDWEGDQPLNLPYHSVIAYSLHVRGYTKSPSSGVKKKGTYAGLVEKIPYLTDLGINQIHCMPVYEFEECGRYTNYWGYGDAYWFAPKSAYAASKDAVRELKDMIKAFHRAGIEVVLEMPFIGEVPKMMILECLRYYRMEYHVDGFVLNPVVAPMEAVYADPLLKHTKILKHDQGFQNAMRRFLKGDEGMVKEIIYRLHHLSEEDGTFNYITSHTGFTLCDLVSYDGKHNEANGENNQDGPDYNFSWNCGAEGMCRKRDILKLRRNQIHNALMLVLLAQGTPCILAGDEFGNSQNGNNNVYCQDNPVGWVNWKNLPKEQELHDFVKELIAFRKNHTLLWPKEEMRGMSRTKSGIPDISYHGENAWQVPSEVSSRQLGVYYSGSLADEAELFVAYNMHWLPHPFALPALPKGQKWYQAISTEEGILEAGEAVKNQRLTQLAERTITVLIGR